MLSAAEAARRRAEENHALYSRGERLADELVHGIGLAAALPACLALLLVAPPQRDPTLIAALAAYSTGLLGMLVCSALYNRAAEGPRKALLRRLDHAAIFVMIAGTYTPVTLLAISDSQGLALLAVVWGGAAAGAALKLFAPARFERLALPAYLALGWAGAVAAPRLLATMPGWALALLLGGGLVYSLGVIAHVSTRLRYHNALWHGCVVTAAGCHYAVVLGLIMAPRA